MSCCSPKPDPEKPKMRDFSLPPMGLKSADDAVAPCCQGLEKKQKEAAKKDGGSCCGGTARKDWMLWGSLVLCSLAVLVHLVHTWWSLPMGKIGMFSHSVVDLLEKMWWGLALGMVAVGLLGKVPRSFVQSLLGPGDCLSGIVRATAAGLLLDLCNHGILLVAMKLYERGASLGQTLAFLIASPWNSLSLTLVLVGLIGLKWTLMFVLLSGLVAVITGVIADKMVRHGRLPANPYHQPLPSGFHFFKEAKRGIKNTRMDAAFWKEAMWSGVRDSRSIVRWILFGALLAAAVRVFVPMDFLTHWFGPTWIGVCATLLAATVIEVCSEGSSPLAADLVTRAAAPGNGFAFLMAGAATDYTEIMALKETTKSWKISFILPLLSLPQVTCIAVILNHFQ